MVQGQYELDLAVYLVQYSSLQVGHMQSVHHTLSSSIAGADLGLLQWWGCSSNAREFLGHAHLIKTTPILIDRTLIV